MRAELQPASREGLTARCFRNERRHECRTGRTRVPRGGLVAALSRFSEGLLDLKVQAGCPQFAGVEIVRALRTQHVGHRGCFVAIAVVKEPLCLLERGMSGVIRRLLRRWRRLRLWTNGLEPKAMTIRTT
jgi:hypothetical protein